MKELMELKQKAIESACELINEAEVFSYSTIHPFSHLHISANMDIDKTFNCLKSILEHKKLLSIRMLETRDREEIDILAYAIKHDDAMIKKVIGIIK